MRAKQGDTVLVHYTGRLSDGTVFDSSKDKGPMRVTIGKREVIDGFERALVGMRPGAMTIENVPPDHAFGQRRTDLIWVVDRGHVIDEGDLAEGQSVKVTTRSGRPALAKVVETNGTRVKVDANHPLAGESLTFEIELVDIVDVTWPMPERPPVGARDSKIILPRDVIKD